MIVWIDVAGLATARALFHLPPLTRHLKTLARVAPRPARVILSGATVATPAEASLTIETDPATGPAGERLATALARNPGTTFLVLDAATAVDPRLVSYLAGVTTTTVAHCGDGTEAASSLVLAAGDAARLDRTAASVRDVGDALVAADPATALDRAATPTFIANLRRSLDFWAFSVPDDDARRRIERQLFLWNYKGSTDFLTKWVYPPIVWPLVRLCTRFGITPNMVTVLSAILTFAAVPMFAAGAFVAGLACAYAMTILDSVDGKVARLTLTDSAFGNVLDHGMDIVHPPFWYLAWAWGLGARTEADSAMLAALILCGFYVGDRLVLMVAKALFKRGLHAVTPLDGAVRTWIARRNVNLVIFTLGLILGEGVAALWIIVTWQGLTMAWHAWRTAWLAPRRHRLLQENAA